MESTEESPARSLEVLPSSEGLESTSEPVFSSSGSPRGVTAPDRLYAGAHKPCSVPPEHSYDSLFEAPCPKSYQTGHGSFGYQPLYISYIPRNVWATDRTDRSSSPVPGSSYPCGSSGHSSGPALASGSGSGSGPGSGSGSSSTYRPAPGPGPGPGPAPGLGPPEPEPEPGLASAPGPAIPEPRHKVSSAVTQGFINIPRDLFPNGEIWNQYRNYEPYQQPWSPLQIGEPGVRGSWKLPEVESKPEIVCKTLPRGQSLLHNWEEERATNHLDQIPIFQDGSESYFFRHGHQGLLTMQLQSPMSSSTVQKDSYGPPTKAYQPLRGKREAMLEMLLHHQIRKEVQAEQEPSKVLFEAESVTHHDYRAKLVQTGPPAPTKVCGVPLSLGQPLPYDFENSPNQVESMSSIACQEGGQGCGKTRTTPA
uniref:Sperm-associated antigen 8 n=1 Tax=Cricetulus griseus TaxID=10029 RepID=A0A8C2N2L5_CRIGR